MKRHKHRPHSIKYKHKLLNTVHKTPQSYKRRADGAQVFLSAHSLHDLSTANILLKNPYLIISVIVALRSLASVPARVLYTDQCRKNSLDQLLGKKRSRLVEFICFIHTDPFESSPDEVCYCL